MYRKPSTPSRVAHLVVQIHKVLLKTSQTQNNYMHTQAHTEQEELTNLTK